MLSCIIDFCLLTIDYFALTVPLYIQVFKWVHQGGVEILLVTILGVTIQIWQKFTFGLALGRSHVFEMLGDCSPQQNKNLMQNRIL